MEDELWALGQSKEQAEGGKQGHRCPLRSPKTQGTGHRAPGGPPQLLPPKGPTLGSRVEGQALDLVMWEPLAAVLPEGCRGFRGVLGHAGSICLTPDLGPDSWMRSGCQAPSPASIPKSTHP